MLVRRQLRRKFGALAEDLEQSLADLDADQLVALGEALLDFSQPADLRAWLNTRPPSATAQLT